MLRGSICAKMGTGSMSDASHLDVKYLLDASNTLPSAMDPVDSVQDSSEASGTFQSNIPYISCVLVIALSYVVARN